MEYMLQCMYVCMYVCMMYDVFNSIQYTFACIMIC